MDFNCPDFPMVGFNTNWIVMNTFRFYSDTTSKIPAISRSNAECTGTLTKALEYKDSNSSAFLACPAETYHSPSSASRSNALYLVRNFDETQGTVQILEITGTPSVANPPVLYRSASIGATNAWSIDMPHVCQNGGSPTITVDADDRFSSCVLRDGYFWAAQNIGVNNDQWSQVQYWKIGIDNNEAVPADFGRIGDPRSQPRRITLE